MAVQQAPKTMRARIQEGIQQNKTNYNIFMNYLKQFKRNQLLDDKHRRRVSFLRAKQAVQPQQLKEDVPTSIQKENYFQFEKFIQDGTFDKLDLEQQQFLFNSLSLTNSQRQNLIEMQQQSRPKPESIQEYSIKEEKDDIIASDVKIARSKDGTISDSNQIIGIQEIYEREAKKPILQNLNTDPSHQQKSADIDDDKKGFEASGSSDIPKDASKKKSKFRSSNKIYENLFPAQKEGDSSSPLIVTGENIQDHVKAMASSGEFSKSQVGQVIQSKYHHVSNTNSIVKDQREKPVNFEFASGNSGQNSKTAMQAYDEHEGYSPDAKEKNLKHNDTLNLSPSRKPVDFNKTFKASDTSQIMNAQALSGNDSKLSKIEIKHILKPKIAKESMLGYSDKNEFDSSLSQKQRSSIGKSFKPQFQNSSGAFQLKSNKIELSNDFQDANNIQISPKLTGFQPSQKQRLNSYETISHYKNFQAAKIQNHIMVLPDVLIKSPLQIKKVRPGAKTKVGNTQRQSYSKKFADIREEKAKLLTDSKTEGSKRSRDDKSENPQIKKNTLDSESNEGKKKQKVPVYQKSRGMTEHQPILAYNYKEPLTAERQKDITASQEAVLKNMIKYQKKAGKKLNSKVSNSPEYHIDNIVKSDILHESMAGSQDEIQERNANNESSRNNSVSNKSQSQVTLKPLTFTGVKSPVGKHPQDSQILAKVTGITQTPVLDFISNDQQTYTNDEGAYPDSQLKPEMARSPQISPSQDASQANKWNKQTVNSSGAYQMINTRPLPQLINHNQYFLKSGGMHPATMRMKNHTTLMDGSKGMPVFGSQIMNINERGGARAADFLSYMSPQNYSFGPKQLKQKNKGKKGLRDSLDSYERRMKLAANGSLYTLGLHDQSKYFQINSASRLRAEQIQSGLAQVVDQSTQNELIDELNQQQERILVQTHDSDFLNKENQEEMRGSQLEFDHISTGINPQYNLTHQDLMNSTTRRYRSNDPRAIYLSAKREQQLIDKRKKIKEYRQKQKSDKKSPVARAKEARGKFQTVKMNEILTLEELLEKASSAVETEQRRTIQGSEYKRQLPFIIGPKTQNPLHHHKQHKDIHQFAVSQPNKSASQSSITQNQSAIISNQSQPALQGKENQSSIHLQTSGIGIKDSLKEFSHEYSSKAIDLLQRKHDSRLKIGQEESRKNIKAYISRQSSQGSGLHDNTTSKLGNIYPYSGARLNEEQIYANLMNFNLPKVISREKQDKSQMNTPGVQNVETPNPLDAQMQEIVTGQQTQTLKEPPNLSNLQENQASQKNKIKGLNLTLQPFKSILITNPWGEPKQVSKENSTLIIDGRQSSNPQFFLSSDNSKLQQPKGSLSQMKNKNSTRVNNFKIMPAGGFKNVSPNKTQFEEQQKMSQLASYATRKQMITSNRASISSGKIQGFNRSSDNQTSFKVGAGDLSVSPNLQTQTGPKEIGGDQVHLTNIPDVNSNQDFTIEEKLIEESYISKENMQSSMLVPNNDDSKTVEIQHTYRGGANQKMVFIDPSQTQQNERAPQLAGSLNSTQQQIEPKIKIENNIQNNAITQVYQSMDMSKEKKL